MGTRGLQAAIGATALVAVVLAAFLWWRREPAPQRSAVITESPAQGRHPLAVAPTPVPGRVKPLHSAPIPLALEPNANTANKVTASRPSARVPSQRPLTSGSLKRVPAGSALSAKRPSSSASSASVSAAAPPEADLPAPLAVGPAPESLTAGSFGIRRREEPANNVGPGLVIYNQKQDYVITVLLRGPKTYRRDVPPNGFVVIPVVPGDYAIRASGTWMPRPGVRPGFIEAPFGEWSDRFAPNTRTHIWLTSRPALYPRPPAQNVPPADGQQPPEEEAPSEAEPVVPVPEEEEGTRKPTEN